ncbi:MAG: PLP-dependent aminotransferase family protein [Epulopiscium sp.]|nr:PLP-dependent aminotransferase family protein [Candidatus Epulonipiscium sp.]
MSVRFARRMDGIKGSEIRELLKLTQQPEVISFAGGLPAPELFPVEGMQKAAQAVMEESPRVAMQYSTTEGFVSLREKIVERMKAKNGISATVDDVLVTSGSQQGLDFSGRVFLDEDDIVLLESPSYLGAINAFKACSPKFIEIPTDGNGMIMEELEKVIAANDRVKMIYVIPDFQNPSGRTWTLERRQKFMDIINKYEIPVIEDNPYGELRFDGESMPSLKSMDTKGLVVFLGSFSKILAPGYRIGWVCAAPEILSKYVCMKQSADLQPSTVSQLEINKFMELYSLDEHVEKIKKVYGHRRDVMLETMKAEFPEGVTYTHPQGGLFTWVVLPEYMNARELAIECIENNVAYVPGGSFFPNGGHENTFRVNYSCMPDDKIIEGVKRLAAVIKKHMK